jgi:protein TonB
MLERDVLASYYFLERRREPLPVRAGVIVSLVTHVFIFSAVYTVSIGTVLMQEAQAEAESGGGPPGQTVVEIYNRRLFLPPPEVLAKLLNEASKQPPERAEVLAEHSSVARGNPNPDARGESGSNKGGGGSGPGSANADAGEKPPSSPPPEAPPKPVTSSTERLPTVAGAPRSETGTKPGIDLPRAGDGPEPTVPGSTPRELPVKADDQQSAVIPRGPISVNARGVGPLEAYRAYLEHAIQQRWLAQTQAWAEANLLAQPVSLTIEFEITRDGRLLSARAADSTGIASLDRAALRAIQLAAPFRPLPDIFSTPSQVFTDTFVYYPPKPN